MGNSPLKICMLADGHGLFDDRIYWKESLSLVKAGYEVHYVLAGEKDQQGETNEGVRFTMLRKDRFPANPVLNFLSKHGYGGLYKRMFKAASGVVADVYHIHDLKVNRIGNKLKKLPQRPRVVYDVHEPFPENILDYWKDRRYFSSIRKIWAGFVRRWEKKAVRNYDLIITTEENMAARFRGYFPDKPVQVIYNYTNLPRAENTSNPPDKKFDAIYTGGITKHRGAWQILEAVKKAKAKIPGISVLFIGTWFPPALKERMEEFMRINKLESNVILKDAVPYTEIAGFYRQSRIGLGIFLPILTHRIILQIKIFEYLHFGLPIVGSNFGHIHRIVREHACGISVDPENPASIAEGLVSLLSNDTLYARMSANARRSGREHFQWETMEEKLLSLYSDLTHPAHDQ